MYNKNINTKINTKLDIIFEDDYIIAINKPAGLLTLPDRYNSNLPSLNSILKNKYQTIFNVHRLDFGTSGVILFAKDAKTHIFLNDQFAAHTIRKFYTAIVTGVIQKDELEVNIPILRSDKSAIVIPSARGKQSLTILKVKQRYRNATLIDAELKTGRQHQLRVHCTAIGHPLLVDELYGNVKEFYISSIKKRFNLKKGTTELPIISRPTLHSREICFRHPINGLTTLIASEPKDLVALLQALNKYASI